MERIAITAMGIASPLGNSITSFTQGLFSGASGVRSVDYGEDFPVPYAALVDRHSLECNAEELSPDAKDSARLALHATKEALHDFPKGSMPVDAIVYGSAEGVSFLDIIDLMHQKTDIRSTYRTMTAEAPLMAIASYIAAKFDHRPKEIIPINAACASGNQAIGVAMQRMRHGSWKRVIVGGVDARGTWPNLLNFHMLQALTTESCPPEKASRPFDKSRSGFVRGEGAATLLLETESACLARGGKVLGYVTGYGTTTDAYRLTDGREDAQCVIAAMFQALLDARIQPLDIHAISAHGTSTPLNDRIESKAIKEVFGKGAYHIPISALKSQIGHATVAAGALQAVACVLMLNEQKVAQTLNFNEGDADCDLDYVPCQSRAHEMRYMLSHNFGFGGQNACIVFERP